MASQDWFDKDFYAILGVSKDVSDAELKKVYRKLARTYHPDSNPGDTVAESKFKEISEAYSVLSDSQSRAEYDQVRAMGGGARFTSGNGAGGGFEDMFGGMFGGQRMRYESGADDLFSGLFGGGGGNPFGAGAGRGRPSQPRKGVDIVASVTIDLLTAARGGEITVDRTGLKPLHIAVPAGVADNQKIRVRGKGERSTTGGPAGDLVLTVSVTDHPVFVRDGINLRVDVPITISEAILGATVEVPTLGGDRVKIKVNPGTPSGRVLRVRGRGIDTKGKSGDLLATLLIVTPEHISEAARGLIEKFRETVDEGNPRDALYSKAEI
ncbi:molecular chaperone DnaJ [Microbacteriaceae bacterium MWH-Ta3]|nr:molecular chaperone DnaJ [Microbacteriaceae bacterium MWH-Ta3]